MTTLELLYDRSTFQLWSWTTHGACSGNQHISIHVQQCIQNMTFLATMGPLGVSPTIHVVVKVAFGEEDVAVLDLEAELYRSQLGPLQGCIVPKCYGYFQCGSSVSCLVLELCNHVINHSICGQQIVNAVAQLHNVGIKLGNLASHHFVAAKNGIRIVGFSTAQSHKCPMERFSGRLPPCAELCTLEEFYGARVQF